LLCERLCLPLLIGSEIFHNHHWIYVSVRTFPSSRAER
jgi:hypothetical protein